MTIGPDISEVLAELGTAFTIKRDSGDISGEYLDTTANTQVTKPFIREFFLEVMLAYDTDVIAGDILEFDKTEDRYLVVHKSPFLFENQVANYDGVIYKCNVSGELLRPSGESDWPDDDYHKTEIFEVVKSNCFALLVPALHGGDLEMGEDIGLIETKSLELYLPSSAGAQVLDRYQPVSGEYYQLESIRKRRFPGVDVAILGEDTR